MGQGQENQQNSLISTMGLKLGRFGPVAFEVDDENYRVSPLPH